MIDVEINDSVAVDDDAARGCNISRCCADELCIYDYVSGAAPRTRAHGYDIKPIAPARSTKRKYTHTAAPRGPPLG